MGNRSCKQDIDYDYRSSPTSTSWNWTSQDEIKKGCKKRPRRRYNVSPTWIGAPVGFENMKEIQAFDPTALTNASYLDFKVKPAPIKSFKEGMDSKDTALFQRTQQSVNEAVRKIDEEKRKGLQEIKNDYNETERVKNQNIGGMNSNKQQTQILKDQTAAIAAEAANQNSISQHSAGQASGAASRATSDAGTTSRMMQQSIVSESDADIASENSLREAGKAYESAGDAGVSNAIAQQNADETAVASERSQQLVADQEVILNNAAVAVTDENTKNEKRQLAALSGSNPDDPELIVKSSATDDELEALQKTTDQVIGALVESGGQSEGVSVQGFANYEGFSNKKKNIEGFTQSGQLTASQATQMGTDFMQSLHRFRNILTNERQVTAEHNRIAAMNEIAELSAAKKDIGTDIFLDYISSDDGSDIHKVYEKKKYENLKNERLIQTQEYEMRIYEEYINIAKVLVIAFVIYAIFAFLNSKSIVGDQLTKILNVIIIACAIFFTIGKIIWLSLRDPINFDKTNQGYDRQYIHDMSGNKYPSKSYNLGMFSGTCVGEACCGPGMIYNSGENSCVEAVAEGFGNNLNGSLIEGMNVKKAQQEILENMFQQTQ